ncbi:MAG: AIM24 family protein [Gemmataceae bacterium]|nr:AIM24 family protein [Gemmataceae bacterium]
MPVPVLMPTAERDAKFGGVTYHIEGELVPVLHVELGATAIYFEHYILLWKDPSVLIGTKSFKGALRRVLAGMPVFMTEAKGPGRIGFSRDGAGHIIALHLHAGESVEVREHQFVAATENVEYSCTRVKGVTNLFLGGTGMFIDKFACQSDEGVLWLHGYGNIFEITLAEGEQIDLEPGSWICKESTVKMETQLQRFSTGFFASAMQLCWNRFTGPGWIAIQSMSLPLQTE